MRSTDLPAPRELLDLTGRVAVVTGASQGIGAGIAARFGAAGASVVVHYRRGREAADTVVVRKDGETKSITSDHIAFHRFVEGLREDNPNLPL